MNRISRESAARRAERHEADHASIIRAARRVGEEDHRAVIQTGRSTAQRAFFGLDQRGLAGQRAKLSNLSPMQKAASVALAYAVDNSMERLDIWALHVDSLIDRLHSEGYELRLAPKKR